jgi:hypothetical protein
LSRRSQVKELNGDTQIAKQQQNFIESEGRIVHCKRIEVKARWFKNPNLLVQWAVCML